MKWLIDKKKCSLVDLEQILFINATEGFTVEHVKALLPLIKDKPIDWARKVFYLPSKKGVPFFCQTNMFAEGLDWLINEKNCSIDELIQVLSHHDKKTYPPLFLEHNLRTVYPLLAKLPSKDVKKILAITDRKEELVRVLCMQNELSFLKDADFMKELLTLSYEEIKEKMKKTISQTRATYPKDQNWLKKIQKLSEAQATLLEEVDAIDKLLELMDTYQIKESDRLALLQIKEVDKSSIEMLSETVEQEGISFSVKSHGLPSHACEEARRFAYTKPFLDRRGQMLLEILKQEGVLEKVNSRV
jgi:hypothetical protein